MGGGGLVNWLYRCVGFNIPFGGVDMEIGGVRIVFGDGQSYVWTMGGQRLGMVGLTIGLVRMKH